MMDSYFCFYDKFIFVIGFICIKDKWKFRIKPVKIDKQEKGNNTTMYIIFLLKCNKVGKSCKE